MCNEAMSPILEENNKRVLREGEKGELRRLGSAEEMTFKTSYGVSGTWPGRKCTPGREGTLMSGNQKSEEGDMSDSP